MEVKVKEYYRYARDVSEGRVLCGELMRLAVERFYLLMDDSRYEFREEMADRVIRFFSSLRHSTGRFAGKPFILQGWQCFIVASVYGFYVRATGLRLVRSVYLEMARKQGKSAFAAGLCLYHLIADGEVNAEVDLAANSKDQATISFKMCTLFSRWLDPGGRYLRMFRDKIEYDRMVSSIRVFAADDSKLDGFNASMYLLDEFHAAKNSKLRDVLQSSQTMRENPMAVIITTAGFDKLGPCYQFRQMCVEVLHGLKEDDSLFAAIYCLDEGDDWRDEGVWIKSNPNLGVTVLSDSIRKEVRQAMNLPGAEVGVKTKTINLWCDSETVWIPDHYLIKASRDVSLEDYRNYDCWAGVDLSATSDLTSVAFMIPTDEAMVWVNRYYLPEAALYEKRFKEQYGEWRRMGALTVTPGNVTDYDYILNDIMDAAKVLRIQNIGYDAWNATQFVINATDAGLPMEPYSQAIGNFNRPTKEMERLILSGKAVIDNNVINRHCFRNVVLARDKNGNIKPSKQFDEKKIDGVIADLMALGVWLMSPRYGEFY